MLRMCLIYLVLPGLIYISPETGFSDYSVRQAASALNTQGYRAYKAGEFSNALGLFKRSVETDPTYGQGHYNLASTMGVLRQQEGPCGDHEVYLDEIIRSLHETLKYFPLKLEKMLADPDLTPVHDTFAWQKIRGLTTSSTKDVEKILMAVAWFGPARGGFGPIGGFDFNSDGTFSYWFLVIGDDVVQKRVSGKYSVSDNGVEIIFDPGQEKGGSFQGRLSKEGVLTFEDEGAPKGPYTDDRDECSA